MKRKKGQSADPTRMLALLWGTQTNPGRSGLTLKAIVAAGIEIADNHGLEALSMHRVAERLGVGTMSLYTHVPGKTELVNLMLDTAYGQLYKNVEEPYEQPGDWRGALRFIAQRNWELYRGHPWMLEIPTVRSVVGPNCTLKYEAELRPLDRLGLSDVEMDATLRLILAHVEGCARAQVNLERTRGDTGTTDVEWWVTEEPLLNKIIDPARFPVGMRVGTAAGQEYQGAFNSEYALAFGMDRILDGIAELIRTKNTQ